MNISTSSSRRATMWCVPNTYHRRGWHAKDRDACENCDLSAGALSAEQRIGIPRKILVSRQVVSAGVGQNWLCALNRMKFQKQVFLESQIYARQCHLQKDLVFGMSTRSTLAYSMTLELFRNYGTNNLPLASRDRPHICNFFSDYDEFRRNLVSLRPIGPILEYQNQSILSSR